MARDIRSLFLTRGQVHPPMSGASLRTWQNINLLAQHGPVALFSVGFEWSRERVKVASSPLSEVEEHRPLRQKATPFLYVRNRLSYLTGRAHPYANHHFDRIGVVKLNAMVDTFRPDVVIFEEPWLIRYLPIVRIGGLNSPKVIYDAHNVEAVLRGDIAEHQKSTGIRSEISLSLQKRRVTTLERRMVRAADQVWVCSEQDRMTMMNTHKRKSQVLIVPNGVNVDDFKWATPATSSGTSKLLMVASFGYEPNAAAAEMLIQSIFPRVADFVPTCRLVLAGRNPTKAMRSAAKGNQRIEVTGGVPDIRPYLEDADIVVVPLLQGGGTRLKILEAFAALRPVVATPKAIEGLEVERDVHALIREDPESFADAVVSLLQNPTAARPLVSAARRLVEERYDWAAIGSDLGEVLEQLSITS